MPLTGFAADHLDCGKLLIGTQVVAGVVQLWHICVFAFLLGCITAFDLPARQTFGSELMGEEDLSNAVGSPLDRKLFESRNS